MTITLLHVSQHTGRTEPCGKRLRSYSESERESKALEEKEIPSRLYRPLSISEFATRGDSCSTNS